MEKFKVSYYDKDEDETTVVCITSSKIEAINSAYDYIDNEWNGDFGEDTQESIKSMLTEHDYYVCGYGSASIEIEEV